MHALSTLCLASSLSALALAGPVGRRSAPAPLLRASNADLVADKYIVVMNKNVSTQAITSDATINTYSSNADLVYNSTIKGFAGALTEAAVETLRSHPGVAYIEQDAKFQLASYTVQKDAPWGISRLSHRDPGSSDYYYDDTAGAGTCSYIIDTGITADHVEFSGRAEFLQNFSGDGHDGDGQGHGTWVAGLVGSDTYGVAKKTRLFGLKVFNDDGATTSTAVLAAMDFAAQDSAARSECAAGVIVNMSLGGGFSQSTNDATDALVDAGIFVAVSAGNDGQDAGEKSPASAPKACTVGATNPDDTRASFSNYGAVVDIFAPGVDLMSTAFGDSNDKTTTASGTSGSSPLIAGLAAYLMALEGNPGGEALCERIKELATKDILEDIPDGTANRLAFNGSPEEPLPPSSCKI